MADFLHYQHRLGVTSLYLHTQKTYKCTVANTNMLYQKRIDGLQNPTGFFLSS